MNNERYECITLARGEREREREKSGSVPRCMDDDDDEYAHFLEY